MAKETTTIDKDLYDGLQQARKKKPRYFALIAKGADVVGLVVQKKVISDGAAQKAKSESKGNLVIQGVCLGEGLELKFEVVGELPSILPKKIKDFIEERTELTLKAQWAVVPKLSSVLDDDAVPPAPPTPTANKPAETTASPVAEQPKPPVAPPLPTPKPAVTVDKAVQDRLKLLLTRQRDLFAKDPSQREKFLKFSQPASSLTMSGSADAPAALDRLEKELGAAESPVQQPAAKQDEPAAKKDEPKQDEPAAVDPKQQQWNEQYAKIEPRFLEVMGRNPADATQIRGFMFYATEQAKAGAYDKALAGLKRLEPMLDAAMTATAKTPATKTPETKAAPPADVGTPQPDQTAPAGPPPDWKTARQAWQDANDDVNDQINGLRKVLLDRAKTGDDGLEGLAAALNEIADKGLNAVTEDHRVKLMASIMEVGDGSPAAIQKFGAKALGLITGFQTFLAGNEKIEVCDDNPFGAPLSIRATLTPPLSQMAAALQAALAPK